MSNSSNYNKELLQNIFHDLVQDSLIKLAKDFSDRLLLAELQYLYSNKIYDNQESQSEITNKLVVEIDVIISKYHILILEDINKAIDKVTLNL